MAYALIEGGIVVNIIWLNESNESDFQNAVALNNRPVMIGDIYVDGVFMRDGVEVLTREEQLENDLAAIEGALGV